MNKVGDIVIVVWWDAKGLVNAPLSEAVPAKCRTIGWLRKDEDTHIVLCTSHFIPAEKDPEGDWTVIPKGWIESMKQAGAQEGTAP